MIDFMKIMDGTHYCIFHSINIYTHDSSAGKKLIKKISVRN